MSGVGILGKGKALGGQDGILNNETLPFFPFFVLLAKEKVVKLEDHQKHTLSSVILLIKDWSPLVTNAT